MIRNSSTLPDARRKAEALIADRNAAVRKDHERRYGKAMPQEAEAARFQRIFESPDAWEKVG